MRIRPIDADVKYGEFGRVDIILTEEEYCLIMLAAYDVRCENDACTYFKLDIAPNEYVSCVIKKNIEYYFPNCIPEFFVERIKEFLGCK